MYDKIFKEHRLVALYSLSIAFLLFVALLATGSRTTLDSQASPNSNITPGCYYKLDCPPRETNRQSVFRCLPTLVCSTPTRPPIPTITRTPSRTTLSCEECSANGYSNLCFDSTRRASYCANLSPSLPVLPNGLTCTSCLAPTSATPTRRPTFIPATPTCFIADCAAPPAGCRYVGGNGCTCGNLVCEVTVTGTDGPQP